MSLLAGWTSRKKTGPTRPSFSGSSGLPLKLGGSHGSPMGHAHVQRVVANRGATGGRCASRVRVVYVLVFGTGIYYLLRLAITRPAAIAEDEAGITIRVNAAGFTDPVHRDADILIGSRVH
jgi:hypothetical protein